MIRKADVSMLAFIFLVRNNCSNILKSTLYWYICFIRNRMEVCSTNSSYCWLKTSCYKTAYCFVYILLCETHKENWERIKKYSHVHIYKWLHNCEKWLSLVLLQNNPYLTSDMLIQMVKITRVWYMFIIQTPMYSVNLVSISSQLQLDAC